MAEDAAQEECERRLRDPKPGRYRGEPNRPRDRRELSDSVVPAQRTRARAADPAHLSPVRVERPPDRDPQPGDAQTRLLLPVAPRQPAVRAWSWRCRARLCRPLLQG